MSAIKHANAALLANLSLILSDSQLADQLETYMAALVAAKRATDEDRVAKWFAEDEARDWNRQLIEYDDIGF